MEEIHIETYRHVDLDTIILRLKNKLVHQCNEAPLNVFPNSLFNLYTLLTVEPHSSTQIHQDSPELQYGISELNSQLCYTGLPSFRLQLKKRFPVTIIRNVLHPSLLNGKMFIVKAHTRGMVKVAASDSNA